MTGPRPGVLVVLTGAAAAAFVALTIGAAGPAMIDPDTAAYVLYFRHIVEGQPLETFIATTPKPLLTLVYGIAWSLTGDWRVLGWLSIAAFGVAVALGAALVARWSGRMAALVLVVALTLSPTLALEVARANSLIWALAAWVAAGLALSQPRPRAWLAGGALLVAFLCRTETIVLLAPASLWIGALLLRGQARTARRLAPLLLAWLALPIACLHDLLLTGDPLYWLTVPAGYTAIVAPNLRPIRPPELLEQIVQRLAGMALLVVLAALGVTRLVRDRKWLPAAAIVSLGAGVTALLTVISWRGVYVTSRYYEQIDVALVVAGAIGGGWIADQLGSIIASRWSGRPGAIAATVVAIAAALAVSLPPAPLQPGLTAELERSRTANRNADRMRPELLAILATATGDPPPAADGPASLPIVDQRRATILVPRELINRLLVDLDAPLTRVGDSWLAVRRDGALASIAPGQVIYHDRAADQRPSLFGPLESDGPISGPSGRLDPVVVDPVAGIWLLRATSP